MNNDFNTANEGKIDWRDLIVHNQGEDWGTLRELINAAPANLDSAVWSDAGITEWPDFFIYAPGDVPSAGINHAAIDWEGFGAAMREAVGHVEG